MLQQRSGDQGGPWPCFWSNSCCSHQRQRGEDVETAHSPVGVRRARDSRCPRAITVKFNTRRSSIAAGAGRADSRKTLFRCRRSHFSGWCRIDLRMKLWNGVGSGPRDLQRSCRQPKSGKLRLVVMGVGGSIGGIHRPMLLCFCCGFFFFFATK